MIWQWQSETGDFFMQNEGEWVMAEKDVTRAILIWKEIQKEYDSEDIREMLKDAQRLLSHIQQNINR